MHLKIRFAAVWAAASLATLPAFAQTTLKLATLAPEGSIWQQALQDAKTEIEAATAGAVRRAEDRPPPRGSRRPYFCK